MYLTNVFERKFKIETIIKSSGEVYVVKEAKLFGCYLRVHANQVSLVAKRNATCYNDIQSIITELSNLLGDSYSIVDN
jgi:predicted nucleotidyltransferase